MEDKVYFNFEKQAYGENGLCAEYKNELRRCHQDTSRLVALSLRQQSIPWMATKIRERLIPLDYIKTMWKDYINGYVFHNLDGVDGYTYTWYVDYDYDNDICAREDVVHITHTVGPTVVIPETKCPVIYVDNHSDVHIVCEGYNMPKFYLFDNSRITIEDTDEESNIIVYKYSGECKVKTERFCLCSVREFDKELRI